ncbi:hypothetical protein AB0L41_02575 [Amycolatopsis mediterranei]|uniref:hypothetical protein n=1 Tax=Amycolatopsis mediterranei TaxID=33910 RepID=UPI00341C1CFB
MRRITAALGALALTTGVLIGATATASAQAESRPVGTCVGSSLEMFAVTGLCVVPRNFPVLTSPAT